MEFGLEATLSSRMRHAAAALRDPAVQITRESAPTAARAVLGECFFILAGALSFALAVNLLLNELGIQ
jgi:hypothetical protein